ncbi:MAG: hypothetical protein IBJ11_06535 [Phycisphaerales bacterium]|nr:hypothetical protein [Phycisphaerales bacterium]
MSFLEKHHFLLRRLHSLTGIVPIGVFLIAHLTTNSSILWGKMGLRADGAGMSLQQGGVTYFHKEVLWINNEVPHLLLIEVALWLSIAFHSVFGVYYAMQGRSNTSRYAYQSNWRYTLQRISGYVGVAFIFYHVATLRWGWSWLVPGGAEWSHHYASSTLALALRGGEHLTAAGIAVSLFYFVGITLLVFHFANGLWTAAITWGLTISATAQRRWGYACLALGAALMAAGWGSLAGFVTLSPSEALRHEIRYYEKHNLPVPPHGRPGGTPENPGARAESPGTPPSNQPSDAAALPAAAHGT